MNDDHLDDETTIALALGDHTTPECQTATAHLERCALCMDAVEQLRVLLAAERSWPAASAPARVLVQLLERQAHQRRALWRRPVPALAAAAIAAALFAAGFHQGRQAPPAGAPAPTAAGTSVRSPRSLPPPPVMPVETAVAAGGDLAFSAAQAQGDAARSRPQNSRRDSL